MYNIFIDGLRSLIETIGRWILLRDNLMRPIQRMIYIVVIFSCGQFQCIRKWALLYEWLTLLAKSVPNLS